jgi:hypothetical protein
MKDYEPYKDELYRDRMILRIKANKSFKLVFKRNRTRQFFSLITNIVNPDFQFTQNIILSLSGLTGTGKSIVMLSMGKVLFPHFSWKNIMFFDQEILDNAHKYPKNTLIIRDENPAKAVFGQGSTRTAGQLSVMAETCRKAGLNLAFIEPEFAENGITKYYLETVDMDLKRRITRCALMDGYTKQFIGAVFIPVVPEDDEDWVKYNEYKDEFIEKVKKGDYSGSKLDYRSIAQECLDDEEFYKYRNKTEKKAYLVQKYPNYTSGEIETILALINVITREGEANGGEKAQD